jgi:uncharacterized pyridoxamine 5'-phosphate oxidase family protein
LQETQEDILQLQAVLDESVRQAGSFLCSSFEMPAHSLSAQQLIHYLQGVQNVAFATVTAKSEPRVAPINALFYRGQFHIPTVATAARTKQALKNSAVSLTHFIGDDLAIIVHGHATVLPVDHPDFETLEELFFTSSGSKVRNWGQGVYLRVKATVIYTYARNLEQFSA